MKYIRFGHKIDLVWKHPERYLIWTQNYFSGSFLNHVWFEHKIIYVGSYPKTYSIWTQNGNILKHIQFGHIINFVWKHPEKYSIWTQNNCCLEVSWIVFDLDARIFMSGNILKHIQYEDKLISIIYAWKYPETYLIWTQHYLFLEIS